MIKLAIVLVALVVSDAAANPTCVSLGPDRLLYAAGGRPVGCFAKGCVDLENQKPAKRPAVLTGSWSNGKLCLGARCRAVGTRLAAELARWAAARGKTTLDGLFALEVTEDLRSEEHASE